MLKECLVGRYGVDCKQHCSGHCRDNTSCNHVTGQCDEGCAAGWRGDECNKGKQNLLFLTFLKTQTLHCQDQSS